jgi:hypothetical protein
VSTVVYDLHPVYSARVQGVDLLKPVVPAVDAVGLADVANDVVLLLVHGLVERVVEVVKRANDLSALIIELLLPVAVLLDVPGYLLRGDMPCPGSVNLIEHIIRAEEPVVAFQIAADTAEINARERGLERAPKALERLAEHKPVLLCVGG